MTSRIFRFIAYLSLRRPFSLLIAFLLLSVLLYANIRNLRLGTNLTDLFGESSPQWRAVNEYTQRFGYGNQLFVVIEADKDDDESSGKMEAAAERLVGEMTGSGYFKYARCGVKEEELLGMARLFAWNFPFFVRPEQWGALKTRLGDDEIKRAVGRAGATLLTPFSSLGTNYLVIDPLGLMEFAAPAGGISGFFDFDLNWGSGGYFYSKDHKGLLVVAEPKLPGTNYKFAQDLLKWARNRCGSLLADEEFKDVPLHLTLAGAYVFAEQDRNFIERNINLVSLVSVVGNLILCVLVYRRISILLMSFVPTALGLLWTTGLISYYPGELNLISLSFIAILVGLGDDNVVHFFNRVPQEWTEGKTLDDAMRRTIDTTGRSTVFCILTTGTATLALTASSFKGLSEFGFVLTVGLVMLLIHTLLTVPALMHVWWTFVPPKVPKSTAFRLLPSVAETIANVVSRHARLILSVLTGLIILALLALPSLRLDRKIEISRGDENPAVVGQRRLAAKFGIGGTPEVILLQGTEEEVLRKAEGIASALDTLKGKGIIKSVFSPSQILPSRETQERRLALLSEVNLGRVATVLQRSLNENGFNLDPFRPVLNRFRELATNRVKPLSLEEVGSYFPQGLLDNTIQKIGENRYLAALAFYPSNPEATDTIPPPMIKDLQREFGPFAEFSYPKISQELQTQIFRDSRRALVLTFLGIVLIVFLCFREIRMTILVLTPIAFAILVTFGLLILLGHAFSFMALIAIPLIIGIGIDNGIHIARRYLESGEGDIVEILRRSGAALLQSNLTTIIGFGALVVSSFEPLAELGLVTALGVGLALAGALLLFPTLIIVFRIRPPEVQNR